MKITTSHYFDKKFRKSPKDIIEKFYIRLDLFIKDKFSPILNNHKLSGEYEGYRSINITGDHRVIFKEIEKDVFLFSDIGTHTELYQ